MTRRRLGARGNAHPDAPSAAGTTTVGDAALAYLPRILIESLASNPDRHVPWWEWVDGTLVMADISGFTALSEQLAKAGKEGAEWLTDVINRFFGRMLDIAWACEGTTITFGGDAILLLFYGDDHERRGIAAGLRMLHGTESLSAYRVGGRRVKLSMSMGAHSGRFLTASAGTEESAQYLILGPEAVRTAQAESAASPGQLAISPELASRINNHVETEPLGEFLLVRRLVNTPRYEATPPVKLAHPLQCLARYLPPFVSAPLREGPDKPMPVLDQEHRSVTVVFVNVLGVDSLLSSEGPDGLMRDVQCYMTEVIRRLDRNGGYLVSNDIYTDGFKLIVAFGAPVAHEHDAQNALRFAAELKQSLAELDLKLSHRIGVNSGFVFAGDVGPAYRRQYTIMGDAVNLSARLMSAAEKNQVIVSQQTAAAAGDCFAVRALRPVRVKGKEQPIDVGTLEGERGEPAVGAPDAATGFFGREEEMRVLEEAASCAGTGQARLVVVRGEAGVGKSRLTGEFEARLTQRGWRVLLGRAYQHTTGQPFAPWLPVLAELTGITGIDDGQRRSSLVLGAVERADPALSEWASLLNPLLRLSLPQSDLARSLDPASRRERMFDLVSALVSSAAGSSPLAIHFEDVHWADGSSIELLERVIRTPGRSRLLMLATQRIDGAVGLSVPTDMSNTIDLPELPREAALGLIGEALPFALPASVMDVLLEKTKGNPLFLQEVARSLDRQRLRHGCRDEHQLQKMMEDIDVPDRVQGLLMAQVDSLPVAERDLLKAASVIGTTFTERTLLGTLGQDAQLTEQPLAGLVRQMFLVESAPPPNRAYDFRHALIQEVAYESMPFSKRRSLHHRVAEHLEDSNREAIEEVYESLVHHYRLSGDAAETRTYALKAGDKSRSLLANEQAVDFYEAGLRCLRARSPEAAFARSVLLERIGDCYDVTGRHLLAADAYKQALERSRRLSRVPSARVAQLLDIDPGAITRNRTACLSHKIGVSYTRTHGDYELSLRWLDRALESVEDRDPLLRARIAATRSVALLWIGEYEESVAVARRAYAAGRRLGDCEVEGRAAATLASALQELGKLSVSTHYRLKSLDCYESIGDVPAQAQAHSNLSATYICRGDLERALHHAHEALRIDERTGDLTGNGITESNLAEILVMRGEYDDAASHLKTALDLFDRAGGATNFSGFARMMLSRALLRSGKASDAEQQLDQAVRLLKKSGATTFLAESRLQRAELFLVTERLGEARVQCLRGLAESRRLGMGLMEVRGLWLLGRIEGALGHQAEAREHLSQSADLARRAGARYERGLAALALAQLCVAKPASCARRAAEALSLLEPTGATPEIEQARRLLSPGPVVVSAS